MSTTATPLIDGVHHLKYPVTDLDVSARWWERAVGAHRQPQHDHIDREGRLFACILEVPGLDVPLELRLNPEVAQATAGFDPVNLQYGARPTCIPGQADWTPLGSSTRPFCAV
jgi:hypothetical protein